MVKYLSASSLHLFLMFPKLQPGTEVRFVTQIFLPARALEKLLLVPT